MFDFLAKTFEKTCSVLAWITVVLWLVLGVVFGFGLSRELYFHGFLEVLVVIAGALLGTLIGFLYNIVVFGYFAQIVSIRKNLELLAEQKQ